MNNQAVAVARYTDYTCTSKEYITDEEYRIRVFVNEESAKVFLKGLGVADYELDWYMYEPILSCSECSHHELDSSTMYQMGSQFLCQNCYYSS